MSRADAPPLSVVMVVRDAARYLGEAIESILAQSFGDFEFLIFDDGSRDGSQEVALGYAKRDRRITLVRGTPEGTPLRAVVHGEHGPMQQVAVYKQDLHDGLTDDAFMLTLPEPDRSWRAIEVPGLLSPQSLPAAALAR